MVKQLSLLTLAAVSVISFAMEDDARVVSIGSLSLEENAGYVIRSNEWEMIKKAVFAKMGEDFKQQFNEQYPTPSDDGVRALADQFDENNKYTTWLKTCPAQLPIVIGGKGYRIFEGRITDIIVEHKKRK
jgi:hypothetical protein